MFVYVVWYLLLIQLGLGKSVGILLARKAGRAIANFEQVLNSNPPGRLLFGAIRSPQREGNIITKNPTNVNYHNTYNIEVPQNPKAEECRTWHWLSFKLLVREICQKLSEWGQKAKTIQTNWPLEVVHILKAVNNDYTSRPGLWPGHCLSV